MRSYRNWQPCLKYIATVLPSCCSAKAGLGQKQKRKSHTTTKNTKIFTVLPSCCSANAGLLKQSKIGEGNVESGAVSVNERRTSSTVLLEPTVVEQNAELQPMVVELQAKAQKLLDIGMLSA